MKVEFWLLDVTYDVTDDEIRLWGVDGEGRRALILDRNFHHYFYLLLEEGANPSEIISATESKAGGLLLKLEHTQKNLLGGLVDVIKVVCKKHTILKAAVKKLKKLKGVGGVLEDDIRYSDRYLIDSGIVPCGWHAVSAKEVENKWGYVADVIFEALETPEKIEKMEIPQLRGLSFSLEYFSPLGVSSEKAFIAVLSAKTDVGDVEQFTAANGDDSQLIAGFVRLIANYDPDVIVGYGSNFFDWKVLLERATIHRVKLDIGRDGSEPHRSVYGHISIAGRANVDLLNYVEREPSIKLKDLFHAAEFFSVRPREKVKPISLIEIPSVWKDEKEELVKFSRIKTALIHQLSAQLLLFFMQFSSVIGLPLDQIVAAAVGFRVECNLKRHVYQENGLIPKRRRRPYFPYKGALVLGPEQGLHANVAVMDFSSMYPSLMIRYNVSPDTYVPASIRVPDDKVNVIPEVGHRFLRSPEGFYKRLLARLIKVRKAIRERMMNYPPTSNTYKLLDQRQRAIKVVTNATYGYAGWIGARWYVRPVAEATAALGRDTIKRALDAARDVGLKIIYADTDGLMLINEPEKIKKFKRVIDEGIGLKIKPDKIYDYVMFTKAKKKYAGLQPDGSLDIVGFESVRGDWAEIGRETQQEVIEILLKDKSVEKARSHVKEVLNKVQRKGVPFGKFIIWKTLTKSIGEYKARTPHGAAAQRLFQRGGELEAGDKIGYVIVKGAGRLYERAIPHALATYENIDIDYYITKQILPLVERCFEAFGAPIPSEPLI